MPFKSEAQRRWMWAHHPEMAREWEEHTPRGKLPERVGKREKRSEWDAEMDPTTAAPEVYPHTPLFGRLAKYSDYDDPFGGDGTRLMPYLRAIYKIGHVEMPMMPKISHVTRAALFSELQKIAESCDMTKSAGIASWIGRRLLSDTGKKALSWIAKNPQAALRIGGAVGGALGGAGIGAASAGSGHRFSGALKGALFGGLGGLGLGHLAGRSAAMGQFASQLGHTTIPNWAERVTTQVAQSA